MAVRRLGGDAKFEQTLAGSESSRIISGWLLILFGDRYFANVEYASLGKNAREEDLDWLQAFPALQSLTLSEIPLTEDGFSRLVGLDKLEQLRLSKIGIVDQGVHALAQLPALRTACHLTPF